MEWQSIESAPKDGTYILVYPGLWTGISASIARWDDDEYAARPMPYWRRIDANNRIRLDRYTPPSHWMPLPDPPKEG